MNFLRFPFIFVFLRIACGDGRLFFPHFLQQLIEFLLLRLNCPAAFRVIPLNHIQTDWGGRGVVDDLFNKTFLDADGVAHFFIRDDNFLLDVFFDDGAVFLEIRRAEQRLDAGEKLLFRQQHLIFEGG